jgi:GAF domain-containing protein
LRNELQSLQKPTRNCRSRNRELALLNQVSRAFTATIDLDQVLVTVLEEVRRLLDVVACSVWLTDLETDELVCQQATGPQSEIVRGWRLAPGQGLAGWVARSGESLIVPDIRADERHFKDVDRQTGLGLRSIRG